MITDQSFSDSKPSLPNQPRNCSGTQKLRLKRCPRWAITVTSSLQTPPWRILPKKNLNLNFFLGLYDCVRSSTCEEKRDRDGSIDIRYLCMLLSKAGQSNILQGQMKIPKLNAPGSLFHVICRRSTSWHILVLTFTLYSKCLRAPQTPQRPTSPALTYSLSLQIELLHRQKPGTNFGLRTLEQTMQVKAALSFTIEQIGQAPPEFEECSASLIVSSFRVIETCACPFAKGS
jgi:hypothetical protein